MTKKQHVHPTVTRDHRAGAEANLDTVHNMMKARHGQETPTDVAIAVSLNALTIVGAGIMQALLDIGDAIREGKAARAERVPASDGHIICAAPAACPCSVCRAIAKRDQAIFGTPDTATFPD